MPACRDCGGRAPILSDLCDDCFRKREAATRAKLEREEAAKAEAAAQWRRLPDGARAWAYHIIKFSPSGVVFRGGNIDVAALSGELNQLGAGGWEVVGVFTSAIAQGATNEVAIILKRPG